MDFPRFLSFLIFFTALASCKNSSNPDQPYNANSVISGVSLIVLGNVQDAGSPHIACAKACCEELFKKPDENRKVVSLGVVDAENQKAYIFDATPDFPEQLKILKGYNSWSEKEMPDGVFITHAHIGHYTGLMYLGKEATNANAIPVYAMPKMKVFLEQNGPWSQLVNYKNISITEMEDDAEIQLTPSLIVTPFRVPHRDEYSETVGYKIVGPDKCALFIPDIDKWTKWHRSIADEIATVDYVFVDATFFDGEEIGHRDISEIPHPFIVESMGLFKDLPKKEKNKVYFIHLNHTNPALIPNSPQSLLIKENGFNVARMRDQFEL